MPLDRDKLLGAGSSKHLYDCADHLLFGKYKSRMLEEIIAIDPTYVRWALENIKEFDITKRATQILKLSLDQEADEGRASRKDRYKGFAPRGLDEEEDSE